MIAKEDQSAPISQACITEAIADSSADRRAAIIREIIDFMNHKRDAYNGIVTSIIYVIDCEDAVFLDEMNKQLLTLLLTFPAQYAKIIFLSKALHRLIQERPEFVARLFDQLIRDLQNSRKRDNVETLHLKVLAIKSIRQSELRARKTFIGLEERYVRDICCLAIDQGDDSTKLDALYFVMDTNMTIQALRYDELEIYLTVFDHALRFAEPSLRQIFLSITNKFIKRINDSHRALVKRGQPDSHATTTELYRDFLERLIRQCLAEIYCGAFFGSVHIVTSIVLRIIEHISLEYESLPIRLFLSKEVYYNSLISCINDPYEENKAACLELLLQMPFHPEIHSEATIEKLNKVAYHLITSVNQANSLTCEYVFRLLVDIELSVKRYQKIYSSRNDIIHRHLGKLLELLKSAVNETNQNFILALKSNCIYPKLTCIRVLLERVDIEKLEAEQESWKPLLRQIVKVPIEACHAVSGIVCNMNPETIGHLPMDLEPVDVDTLATNLSIDLDISNDDVKTVTSQMLLISGWKTIKECSLALGVLSTRFWWPKERIRAKLEKYPGFMFPTLLESSQMEMIIGYFNFFLRHLRHRGAFEQAYNGFSMVAKRVWQDKELQESLRLILNDIIDDFKLQDVEPGEKDKKIEHLKAYVTRRSAGIPFIFQSILSAEPRQESKTLDWAMSSLFEVLDSETSQIYQKIHCLNILRALMKDHHLGEKVPPYIGRTFAVIMDSFRSESFPIRNCANMLLKSTVDRTFGINRLRDTIHSRNKLSFDKFFSECPDLPAKMLQILEEMRPTNLASVHSVFIVLSRLRVGLSTNLQIIRPFIDPLKKIALECPDFKLREIASELCVRLDSVSTDLTDALTIDRILNDIEQSMYDSSKLRVGCKNLLHGNLLLIKNWIKVFESKDCQSSYIHSELGRKFAMRAVRDVLVYGETTKLEDRFAWASLQCAALDIVETDNLASQPRGYFEGWLPILISSVCQELKLARDNHSGSLKQPHREQYIFKIITSVLMNLGRLTEKELENQLSDIEVVRELIAQTVDGASSNQLKSAISRVFAQIKGNLSECEQVDGIIVDYSASFVTPFDKLEHAKENDSECQSWRNFCKINWLPLSTLIVEPAKSYHQTGAIVSSKPRAPVRYIDSLADFCYTLAKLFLNDVPVKVEINSRTMRGVTDYMARVSDVISERYSEAQVWDSLIIPETIMKELGSSRSIVCDNIGDYSWLQKTISSTPMDSHDPKPNNLAFTHILARELKDDISHFETRYWNMLTDTRYYIKELSLLKRVTFLRQVCAATDLHAKIGIDEIFLKLRGLCGKTGILQECERQIQNLFTNC